jgi:hypothetical protein
MSVCTGSSTADTECRLAFVSPLSGKHTTTGASNEKKKKLEELTKKRSEKSKKAGAKVRPDPNRPPGA